MIPDECQPRFAARPLVHVAGSRLVSWPLFLRDGRDDFRRMWPAARRLFRRRLARQYRFSSPGRVWAFVPAIVTALVLVVGGRAHVIGDESGRVPAVFCGVFGLTLAQTFLDAVATFRRLLVQYQPLLQRQNVPLEGFVAAGLLEAGFGLLVRPGVLAIVWVLCAVAPTVSTLPLAAWGMCGVLCLGVGCGLMVAPVNSLSRDADNLMAVLPWIVVAVTPVSMLRRTDPPRAAGGG